MKPSIGRVVHFIGHTGIHHAAIITAVHSDIEVDLVVFQIMFVVAAALKEKVYLGSEEGTWHWPEIVDQRKSE